MPSVTGKQILIGSGVLAGVAGVVTGLVWLKKTKDKRQAAAANKEYTKATVGSVNVIETATQLAMDLGYYYPSWDPRRWTENDSDVYNTIAKFPQTLMGKLKEQYTKMYSRNLQADVQKLLPASDYQKIRSKFL